MFQDMAWPDRPRLEGHDVLFEVVGRTVSREGPDARERWLMAQESIDEADGGAFMQNQVERLKEQSLWLVPERTIYDTTSGAILGDAQVRLEASELENRERHIVVDWVDESEQMSMRCRVIRDKRVNDAEESGELTGQSQLVAMHVNVILREDVQLNAPRKMASIWVSFTASSGPQSVLGLYDASEAFFHGRADGTVVIYVRCPPGICPLVMVERVKMALYGTQETGEPLQELIHEILEKGGYKVLTIVANTFCNVTDDSVMTRHKVDYFTAMGELKICGMSDIKANYFQ